MKFLMNITFTPFFHVLSGHAIFKLIYLSNHDYKVLYFESDAATVNEIVLKVKYPSKVFIVIKYCILSVIFKDKQ